MPLLSNPRHEHFAQLVASGLSPTNAYTSAGYSAKGAHASANRLLQVATVGARVEELAQAAADRTIEQSALSRVWVLDKLKENVARAMQEQAVTDREGNATGEYTYQGAVANRALELIGKELGMFVERIESKSDVNVTDSAAAAKSRLLAQLAQRPSSAGVDSDYPGAIERC